MLKIVEMKLQTCQSSAIDWEQYQWPAQASSSGAGKQFLVQTGSISHIVEHEWMSQILVTCIKAQQPLGEPQTSLGAVG